MTITPEQVHWLGGILLGCIGAIVTGIGFMVRAAYKVGANAEKFNAGLTKLTTIETAVAEIPVIKRDIGTLQDAWRAARSDITDLLRERRGSRPDPEEAHAEE